MRDVRGWIGTGVLVLGVGVLGWWARGNDAVEMQATVTDAAKAVAAGAVHGVQTDVSGRDIRVSGIADGPEERDALVAALNGVKGRRVVVDDLTVLDRVSPFTLNVTKAEGAALSATGHVPTEAVRGDLSGLLGDSAAGLTLAAGAPVGWADLAKAGIAALGPMNSGEMALADGALSVRGVVNGPAERDAAMAALAGMPQGAASVDLELLDDGTPPAYDLTFDAGNGARLSGKLPRGLSAEGIAGALGLTAVVSDAKTALLGDEGDLGLLGKLKAWLPRVETLRVQQGAEGATVAAGVAKGVNAEALREAMAADLGDAAALDVATATPSAEEGAERVNVLTGKRERLSGGYWLQIPEFAVGRATCQEVSDGVLTTRTVNFLSGSDQLDAGALEVLNEIASVVRECVVTGGLKAEIGGHTDSSGNADSNRRLSQLRAAAVRSALIERGVPREALVSKGYGADQPVADNETEEGRAKNRRTTVIWSE